eukprot:9140765-Ditylum_brightwellii.AAC.1
MNFESELHEEGDMSNAYEKYDMNVVEVDDFDIKMKSTSWKDSLFLFEVGKEVECIGGANTEIVSIKEIDFDNGKVEYIAQGKAGL